MKNKNIVIVGAGIGGLTAAVHLAKQGCKVTVVEKNARAGGRCDQIIREGHVFDTGPTLMVMPLLYEAEFQAMGTSMQNLLDLQRVDPTYHLFFDDNSSLTLTSDMKTMSDQLESMEKGSLEGFLRYMEEGSRHYRLGIEKLVNREFRHLFDFFSLKNAPLLWQVKPFANHYQNMGQYFKNPRLKVAFTFQDMYMGLSPFNAAATFSLMPYCELAQGVWYPRGGMYSVSEALYQYAKDQGVEFIFNNHVQKINVVGNRATSVKLEDGSDLPGEAVLANADLPYVYQSLLPHEPMADQLLKKEYSCSVISFFWGVKKRIEGLHPHNLFLADDYRENFDSIIKDLTIPENPSLYVHAPTRLDPSLAPEGQDTVTAVVPVGHLNGKTDEQWFTIRDRARQAVFQRLAGIGVKDLEENIKFEVAFMPQSWQARYNLVKGATHGLSHTLMQLAYFRPHNRHAHYKNLYFAGASTHPGTGMPTAMISGRLAAARIMEKFNID